MITKILAKKLLNFLNQKEDFETLAVLKKLTKTHGHSQKQDARKASSSKDFKLSLNSKDTTSLPEQKQDSHSPKKDQVSRLSIYDRLAEKVKKACPELRIKQHIEIKNAGIPDCDVIVLTDAKVPEVYQSLAKAIDKQLALTETIFLDSSFMGDLLTKSYKLVLASPHAKNMTSFMQHVKITGKKQAYIGSSPLLFLEEPNTLSTSVSHKQALWQSIKTILT